MGKVQNTEIINEIISLQKETNRFASKSAIKRWIELDLTIAQLKSLFFIGDKEKTNFKKLADALGVTPPNVTGIIDRLVENGLVNRIENSEDRRIITLQLTTKGRHLINSLQSNPSVYMADILAQLSIEELSSLASGMRALVKAAKSFKDETQIK